MREEAVVKEILFFVAVVVLWLLSVWVLSRRGALS
jgi:hypothetical protein